MDKTMTVEALIEALQKLDPGAEVWTEGCDCYGDVGSIAIGESRGRSVVMLARSEDTRGLRLGSEWEVVDG